MARRKVVTTVCIDPDVFNIGREDGFNFSRLLERAIIDEQDPERKITSLKAQIKYHEDEVLKLRKEIEIEQKAENKIKKMRLRHALENYLEEYKKFPILSDEVEQKLCASLKLSPEELVEAFEECINSEEV